MYITRYKKWFVGFSVLLVLASLIVIVIRGIDYGVEFTGGSVLEIVYQDRPDIESLRASVHEEGFSEVLVQPFGENGYVLKTKSLDESQQALLIHSVTIDGKTPSIERLNSVGPSVGNELRTKSLYSLIAVSLGIILFVAYAFRKISFPVSSWKYGIVATIALLHDIVITVGVLTLVGTEVDTLYVVGLLSILGLSVNDTIVVFDRIRDTLEYNTTEGVKENFSTTVGRAINDTMIRSIFTSLTLIIVLIALYIFGPEATRTLSLVLLIGMAIGTYSSVFLASPILTMWVNTKSQK